MLTFCFDPFVTINLASGLNYLLLLPESVSSGKGFVRSKTVQILTLFLKQLTMGKK